MGHGPLEVDHRRRGDADARQGRQPIEPGHDGGEHPAWDLHLRGDFDAEAGTRRVLSRILEEGTIASMNLVQAPAPFPWVS